MEISAIAGVLILVGDVWAIVNVVGSGVPPVNKLLWCLVIVLLPLVGLVIWLLAGPRSAPRV